MTGLKVVQWKRHWITTGRDDSALSGVLAAKKWRSSISITSSTWSAAENYPEAAWHKANVTSTRLPLAAGGLGWVGPHLSPCALISVLVDLAVLTAFHSWSFNIVYLNSSAGSAWPDTLTVLCLKQLQASLTVVPLNNVIVLYPFPMVWESREDWLIHADNQCSLKFQVLLMVSVWLVMLSCFSWSQK